MTALRTDDPDLLGRQELVGDLDDALQSVKGRRILVTGAGGSLGRLLSGVLTTAPVARLTLLDHHEHSLFALQRSLAGPPSSSCSFVLGDVRDGERMARVIRDERPEVIFHLAAYKHVPFGELFPEETVGVNVLATRALLRLAEQEGLERFVYPSSDKAVDPPSLYGATKRLSEVLVSAAGHRGRAYTALRYMNVLGTHGGVLETFAAQLCAGQPLSVTDRAMTRYWISQREAIWLALEAARAPGGSLLMLDVREEIPVVEMAARLARQLGRRDGEYTVQITGPRPGERLREQVLGPHERAHPGPKAGLLAIEDIRLHEHAARVDGLVDELSALLSEGDPARLREAAMSAAQSLQ